jgi:phosphate uptake regulator
LEKETMGKREVRKLQITGGSTYIISLPKKWIKKVGLEKGSPLSIINQEDGSIIIVPEEMEKPKKPVEAIIEVSTDNEAQSIIRKIVSIYLVGYNIIFIRPKNQRLSSVQRTAIKNFTRRMLVGTEIIADSPTELILKVLISYPELSVQSALRRMCVITASMHQDAIAALREFDKELARDVVAMDDEVDRFGLYIIRQLKAAVQNERVMREIGLATGRDCLGYRLVTKAIERTADHAVEIAKNVLALKKPLKTEILREIDSIGELAVSVFNKATESIFKRDFQLANNTVQKAKEVALQEKEVVERVLKRAGIEEIANLRLIIESIRRTAEYASDIAEIVLNMTVENVIKTEGTLTGKVIKEKCGKLRSFSVSDYS